MRSFISLRLPFPVSNASQAYLRACISETVCIHENNFTRNNTDQLQKHCETTLFTSTIPPTPRSSVASLKVSFSDKILFLYKSKRVSEVYLLSILIYIIKQRRVSVNLSVCLVSSSAQAKKFYSFKIWYRDTGEGF